MQLYPTEHSPPWHSEIICRQSWLVALRGLLIYVALGGVPAALWYAGELPKPVSSRARVGGRARVSSVRPQLPVNPSP